MERGYRYTRLVQTTATVSITALEEGHARALTELLTFNREYLRPWNMVLPDSYFTEAGQRGRIRRLRESGAAYPFLIERAGQPCGTINLSNIVLGAWRSCNLGYWVDERATGCGVASEAVRQACEFAFAVAGLHRVEAGTLPWNAASQRVLAKNGFERFGYAPNYLEIEGEWRDHILFQRLAYPGTALRT